MTTKPKLGQEIAVIDDGIDITRGHSGPLLTPYDSLLTSRGAGDLRLYEGVLSDWEVQSCMSQRRLAVTSAEWAVDAGGTAAIDKEAAEDLKAQLHALKWDNTTGKMHYGVLYGFSVAELIYKAEGKRIVAKAVKVRNRRRFKFDKEQRLRLLTQSNMTQGVLCDEPYFWHFATGSDNDDEPYGMGLAHWLYWPVLFKRQGMKFWLQFLDKMAIGTAVGKYGSTATEPEKATLLRAASALAGGAAAVTIPEAMQVELLNAARAGTPDYKTLCDYMDAAIQKVLLGQTASTQGTPGRLGNDDLQGDVRSDIVKADADLICESWNTGPARWLTEWNFPGAKIPRVYRVTEEPEDLTESADRDTKVKALGFKPTLKYVKQKYGEDWEEDKRPATGAQPGAPPDDEGDDPLAAFAEGAEPDVPARMVPQLERDLRAPTEAWIRGVRELIDEVHAAGGSLADLRDRLVEKYPALSLEDYAAALARAQGAAHLAGRSDVQDQFRPDVA